MKKKSAASSASRENSPSKCSTPKSFKKLKTSVETTSQLKLPQDPSTPISEVYFTPLTSNKPQRSILSRILAQKGLLTPPDTPAATDYSTPMTSRAPKFRIRDKSLGKLDLNTTDDVPADDTPSSSKSDSETNVKSLKLVLTPIDMNKIDEVVKDYNQSRDASENNGSENCVTPCRISRRFVSEDQSSNSESSG